MNALHTTVSSLQTNITESTSSPYFSRNLRTVPVNTCSRLPTFFYKLCSYKKKRIKEVSLKVEMTIIINNL